ncbi:hypothetical protein, partial [Pseudonocardia lacus]|uniref:hypothetical protein n=1 Tax=Pseudonocardia lacus TaxID=2835865 RepID=UPI001BDCC2C5
MPLRAARLGAAAQAGGDRELTAAGALLARAERSGTARDWLAFIAALADAGRPLEAVRHLRLLWRGVPASAALGEAGALDRSVFLLNGGAIALDTGLRAVGGLWCALARSSPHPDVRYLAGANLGAGAARRERALRPDTVLEATSLLVEVVATGAADEAAAAVADLEGMVAVAPRALPPRIGLARALREAGRAAQAAEQAERAVAAA